MLNEADYNSFSGQFSDYLNHQNHFNLKLFNFEGILSVLKFEFQVQDFGKFELSSMQYANSMILSGNQCYTAIFIDILFIAHNVVPTLRC